MTKDLKKFIEILKSSLRDSIDYHEHKLKIFEQRIEIDNFEQRIKIDNADNQAYELSIVEKSKLYVLRSYIDWVEYYEKELV